MRTQFIYLTLLIIFLCLQSGCATLLGEDEDTPPAPGGRSPAWYQEAQQELKEKQGQNSGDSAPQEEDEDTAQRIAHAIRHRDIVLGMPMQAVLAAWGQPIAVDAQDTQSGNERWTFYTGISPRYSVAPKRVVYFEAGRVVGWQTIKP